MSWFRRLTRKYFEAFDASWMAREEYVDTCRDEKQGVFSSYR